VWRHQASTLRAIFREYASASATAAAAVPGSSNASSDFFYSSTRKVDHDNDDTDVVSDREWYYYHDYYKAWAPLSATTPAGKRAAAHGARLERDRQARAQATRAAHSKLCSHERLVQLLIDFNVLVPGSVPSPHDRKSAAPASAGEYTCVPARAVLWVCDCCARLSFGA
jgi:hypothetical protein